MAERKLWKYNAWCVEDQAYYAIWAEKPPTVCPDNSEHAIDANKTQILDLIKGETIEAKIREQDDESTTKGRYLARTLDVDDIPASVGWHKREFVFPIDLDLLSAEWANKAEMEGDKVKVHAGPAALGPIAADVAAGVNVIPLSAGAIVALDAKGPGYGLELDDGVNREDLGHITAIDTVANTVTTEKVTANAFAAATPTLAETFWPMVPCGTFYGTHRVQIGEEKIGGSFLATGKKVRIWYYNNDGGAGKKLIVWAKALA